MAESPAHRFGQIVGDLLEVAVEPILRQFALEYGLYLDKKGPRPARKGNKVSWTDLNGNVHDLDFVLEKDGSAARKGTPVAFIEAAWRRYTKHSRNKAQEIQGAIMPLVETYKNIAPFFGAILAGVFTENALTQLKSLGFAVLYFPYENVISAFSLVNIDAACDEHTPDDEYTQKIAAWKGLSEEQRTRVANALINNHSEEVAQFIRALKSAVTRQIESVRVIPLHGIAFNGQSIEEAIEFIEKYNESSSLKPLVRYEIEIRYVNGDLINGRFEDRERAIHFLHTHHLPASPPKIPPGEQYSLFNQT
jgi:hypothetical protein